MIAICDDDICVRSAVQALVRSLGYATATFGSPDACLRSSALESTACLLSDVEMPGMNGGDLHRRLRALGHRFPVIFMTANDSPELRAELLAGGAVAVLNKPFGKDAFVACLDRALRSAGDDLVLAA
jgi:FixJ family two-component response regulator